MFVPAHNYLQHRKIQHHPHGILESDKWESPLRVLRGTNIIFKSFKRHCFCKGIALDYCLFSRKNDVYLQHLYHCQRTMVRTILCSFLYTTVISGMLRVSFTKTITFSFKEMPVEISTKLPTFKPMYMCE